MKITINWFFIIALLFAVWLGATDKVSWWVISLIFISQLELNTEFKVNK